MRRPKERERQIDRKRSVRERKLTCSGPLKLKGIVELNGESCNSSAIVNPNIRESIVVTGKIFSSRLKSSLHKSDINQA